MGHPHFRYVFCSRLFYEAEAGGVHAVTQAGGLGTVVEDVAEVGVAFGAGDGDAGHSKSRVADLGDVFFGDGLPEAHRSSVNRPRTWYFDE